QLRPGATRPAPPAPFPDHCSGLFPHPEFLPRTNNSGENIKTPKRFSATDSQRFKQLVRAIKDNLSDVKVFLAGRAEGATSGRPPAVPIAPDGSELDLVRRLSDVAALLQVRPLRVLLALAAQIDEARAAGQLGGGADNLEGQDP